MTTMQSRRGRKYKKRFDDAEQTEPSASVPVLENEPEPEEVVVAKTKKDKTTKATSFTQDSNLIDIWERRMVNPYGEASVPIHIKTPGMHLRWINTAQEGRYQRAVYTQGWMPVHKDELHDEREVQGAKFTTEGYVTRGERQAEMLMKMPEAIFRRIRKSMTEALEKEYRNIRQNLQQAGSLHFGDKYGGSAGEQASDAVTNFKGTVKFGKETVTLGDD